MVDALQRHESHVGGTRFRVVEPLSAPAGETLVFLHGVGMTLDFWEPQLDSFAPRHRCIAYDMLGHGQSALPPAAPSLADYSAQFASLSAALETGPVTLIGHSMGALIALDAALRYPALIRRAVVMNGVYDRTPKQKSAIAARVAALTPAPDWTPTLDRWFGGDASETAMKQRARLADILARIQPEGYARTYGLFARADGAHVGRLGELTMPILFLTGEDDPNSTPAMSRAMQAASPRGQTIVLPGERHMMSFTNPSATNTAIAAFLAANAI